MRNRNNLSAVQNIFTKSHLVSFKFAIVLFASFSTIGVAQIPIPLGTLQPGDSLCIIYDAKINNNIASEMVSVQGKVTANGPITVLSDDPDTGPANDATKTSVCLPLDFGDAPDPVVATTGEYPTLLANNGARHVVVGGSPILGASIDSEADGQPNATGDGDDMDANGDDEDGVSFTSSIVLGTMASVDVTASATGQLDAWMDFNQNGNWDDAGEQIFTSQALAPGINALSFSVPGTATEGNTFARFRLSTAGGLAPTGLAPDGEIEDYQVNIIANSFSIDDPMVSESGTHLIFTITRTTTTSEDSVDFSIVGGTATPGIDYTDVTMGMDSTIAFPSTGNVTSKTISIPIISDLIVELDETILTMLSSPKGGGISDGSGTGTIKNNDTAMISIDSLVIPEGALGDTAMMTFTATLDKIIDVDVNVNFATSDVSAQDENGDDDYLNNSGIITFVANGTTNQTKTMIIKIIGDGKVEPDEMFDLVLSNIIAMGRTVEFCVPMAVNLKGLGTITNDDAATLTLAAVDASKNEGTGGTTTPFTFSVTLDSAVQGGFSVDYTTNDGTAMTADNDYLDNDGSLNFNGTASSSKMITVLVNHDGMSEGDEMFNVALGAISGLAAGIDPGDLSIIGSPQNGTIIDDDCDLPDIPTLNTPAPICMGTSADIMVLAGNLDDATHWTLYKGSCGGTLVATSATGMFTITPLETTTYFVRGEGGCVPIGTGACAQVTVTVEDITPPMALCQDLTVYLDKSGNASITAAMLDNGSTDNCGITSMTLDKMAFTCNDLGPNLVILTVGDLVGNMDTCHATVTVEDIQINTTPHIVGMSPVCPGLSNVPYSIVPDPNVTSYQWSYSGSGATIIGDGGPSIEINFAPNSSAGTLTVEYITACGPNGIKDNFAITEASEFTCQLALACPDNLWVINTMIGFPGGINIFKASINVLSAVTIETDQTVLFRSGQEINLLPNFEVALGALFKAEIQGCGETFQAGEMKKEK